MKLWILFVVTCPVWAQTTASLHGRVLDPTGAGIAGVNLVLENPAAGFRVERASGEDGGFAFGNLPFAAYSLNASHAGFESTKQPLALRSNIPVELTVTLAVAGTRSSITVDDTLPLTDPESSTTYAQINQLDIDRIPAPPGARGLEAALIRFPGFAKNANGAIHPRGAHNQMTFVVDGMPISDQLNGAFANTLDPSVAQTVELFTGNISAEYFGKTGAVANITTRSGFGSGRRMIGNTTVEAAQFDLLSQTTQIAGEGGRWGYSASTTTMKSHRFLDQVSLANLHNGGNSQRGFSRVDYQASPRDALRLTLMTGRSSFELANLRSQAKQDQRQRLADVSAGLGWVRSLTPNATLDATASYRTAQANFTPSAADTPYTAAQDRHLTTVTLGLHATYKRLRYGGDYQTFPVSEHFAIQGSRVNFDFRAKATGQLRGLFLQDSVRLGDLTLSLGLRYDQYRFLVDASQWQPRIGAAYVIKATGTVLRASYNRTFQTPPNENLLLSAAQQATPIRPERQNVFELGLQQPLGKRLAFTGAFYHKNALDQQDNNNFLNTGVIFPITLKSIRVNGAEGRLTLLPVRGFSANLSATHSRSISNPPFTGGLFLGNEAVDILSLGPFVIDHDQFLSLHLSAQYNHAGGWWIAPAVRYDSGLVANPSDPAQVAADPDFADLLPYVKLTGGTPRVRPRTITDLVFGYTPPEEHRWEFSVTVGNLFDVTALYNFQSIFVGTRLVAPRTFGARLRWFF
jgi:outer membrane cobalamin receptor